MFEKREGEGERKGIYEREKEGRRESNILSNN